MKLKFNIKEKLEIFPFAQLYLSLSIMFGTWVIYIPSIIEKLNMNEGQLGIALFFAAFGSVSSLPFGKKIVTSIGEGKSSLISILMVAIFISTLFISPSFYWLCFTMYLFGISSGIMQVAINSLVATVERERQINIMSTCHGFFSLGAMISAGFGTIIIVLLNNPLLHILLALASVILLQILFKKKYFHIVNKTQETESAPTRSAIKNKTLWLIGAIAIIGMVSEGAIADWSGLYLKDIAKTNMNYLGLGYAGFSLAMTIGRFSGDYLSSKFGAWQIILAGYVLALIGFSLVLLGHPLVSIVGFFTVGLGFSIIVPEVYRLSANIEGVNPASGIAFMAGVGYVGFLTGPVVLGFLAEHFGLQISFSVLLVSVFLGFILSIFIWARKRA
ncbi:MULTISPECIES: MFS transporter [unclassified Lentimicrobium]|uniref:MFS transporter n=1 Tax=unclassified Lentimicrobium TaxID=2677434 RepID=UPI001552D437|nr:MULTISPECIES: MFS transporter [unclassified Lentimicrobium]NPD44140.1 MFS transporter [Lentimicrobium sp. S6]NPD83266.1 MFS transporter [Lentimicrobium sp. L6]